MVTSFPIGVPEGSANMFYATSQHKAMIWWWKKDDRWHWLAADNSGEEATEREAIDRAKRWIRDGQ